MKMRAHIKAIDNATASIEEAADAYTEGVAAVRKAFEELKVEITDADAEMVLLLMEQLDESIKVIEA